MSDPYLDAHRRGTLHYTINGPSPISIRDQTLRGVSLVQRLKECGEIGPSRPLAVIGAGAGGASAAIEATNLGITCYLIESAPAVFSTQSLATGRILDPTQYDWPVDHCYNGVLPWGSQPGLPLPFPTRPADRLSVLWQTRLIGVSRRLASKLPPPKLHVLHGAVITAIVRATPKSTSSAGPLRWIVINLVNRQPILVGCIIDAKGAGNENCRVESPPGKLVYEGQPFWGPDNFTSLDASDRVLISGSGDGAMQDYLRVITHLNRAIDIEKKLGLGADILREVQSAEDRARRGLSWASDDGSLRFKHENPYWTELDMAHDRIVTKALSIVSVRKGLNLLIPADPVPVCIVHRERFLTCYYGLNRFLAKLIARFVEEERGRWITFYPCWEIDNIAG